jgi:hypothetical protein
MPNCDWPDCGILLKFPLLSFDTDVELGLLRCVHTSVRFDANFEIRRIGSPCVPGSGCQCRFPSRPSLGGFFDAETELRHGRFAMRLAGFLAFCRCRLLGFILAGAMVSAGVGCHQHYYYYGDGCAPGAPVPSSVRTGPVCDVPVQSVEGGTSLASGSTRSTVVSGGSPSNSSRVVVSEASEPSRVAWRRSDPDGSLATTSVQGTTNDSSVNR